jgi:hypothetical protein
LAKAPTPASDKPTATWVIEQADKLHDALAAQRLKSSMVLSHFYNAAGIAGFGSSYEFDPNQASTRYRLLEGLTHQNQLRAVLETRLSQTVRVPDIRVQTIGGRWGKQFSARKMGQWLSGSLRRQDFGRTYWQVATDASTCPVAAARIWVDSDGLHLQRVRPDQIKYNPREGKRPSNLTLHYGVPRSQLIRQYPKFREYLNSDQAPTYKDDPLYVALDLVGSVNADLIAIHEHWRLGTSKEMGVYTVACGDRILNTKDEETDKKDPRDWKWDFFPVIELVDGVSWDNFGGHPLGEMLLGYQLTINRMNKTIESAQERLSKGRIFLPKGSEVDKQQFSRTAGEFITFFNGLGGGKPVIMAGQAVSPDYYNRLDKVENAMWELAGVSKSQGTGTLPAGLQGASGKAQQEYNDVASTRLKAWTDNLDNWTERLATIGLSLAVDFLSNGGKMAVVNAPGTSVLTQVNLTEDDGISVRVISVSGLPAHPSSRLDYVSKLVDNQFVDRKYGAKLLSIPDVEKIEDTATSAMDLATYHIEETLYKGRLFTPEPNPQYLEILLDLGTRELMQALRLEPEGDEETKERDTNIELLRRLLETGSNMMKKLAPPPAPAPMPGPGGTGGPPPIGGPGPASAPLA